MNNSNIYESWITGFIYRYKLKKSKKDELLLKKLKTGFIYRYKLKKFKKFKKVEKLAFKLKNIERVEES
ncbi:hypothetical protein BpHYR1_038239 [Brachionus plicatilis]|uniref:Uncharacterized protein n=1 Tax=Brachionus plicatilis TaxID=10195 RepID=A0A3M7PDQ8_BRAPC|nr:hypothetical protein BpHYR1_038239 [Brachionus plicatilis]